MGKDGNGQICWMINPNCEAVKISDPKLKDSLQCEAYKRKKGCWEIDWSATIADKSEPEKGFWKGFYNVGCRACPVYKHHRTRIENMIDDSNKV